MWQFVASNSKKVTVDAATGKVGIGVNAEVPLAGSLHTEGDRGTQLANLRVVQRGITSYAGVSILSYSGDGRFGYPNSGLNVTDTAGSYFSPVYASAFTVASDRRMKKEISPILSSQYGTYMNQIRNIESATYYYNNETSEQRKVPHVGFIAQTLPEAVQMEIDLHPDGSSPEKRIGYNLSDFAGLSLIGIKALDHNQQELEAKIKTLEERIAQLEKIISEK